MSAIYTLRFGEDVARDPEERLAAVAEVTARIADTEDDTVVVLPGGFVQADSHNVRDRWADGLLAASRAARLGVVFGLDVVDRERWGVERCPRSFAYACERGRPLLWGAPSLRGCGAWAQRAVTFAAFRVVVLLGRELFQVRARELVDEKRPDAALLLAHAPPTARWLPALRALDALAPTLVAHQALRTRRSAWTETPRGYLATVTDGPVRVASYRREVVGAILPVVGD